MEEDNARRQAAAQEKRERLRKELIQLEIESELLFKLKDFAETIADAYDGLRQYQDGKVPGQEGVVLDHKVSRTQTSCICFCFFSSNP
jgi:hypothetical protein